MILKIFLCLIWLIITPLLIGMIYTYFKKDEKNNILLIFLSGYFIEFAIFEVLALPMTFLKCKFTTLLYTYAVISVLFAIFSIILNRKNFKNLILENVKQIKKLPVTTILVVILIILQMFILFRYMHIDDDDAVYVANGQTSIDTNTLNVYNPTIGYEWGGWPSRYVLSPFSIYLGVISELTQVPVAITAHTIFPVVFLPMVYMIFALIANELFDRDKHKTITFLLILNILYIFGNYSRRTSFSVLFLRIWQGKAFLANIIIPAIWYFIMINMKENKTKSDFIMLIAIMLSSCMVSSMGIALAPILVMCMAFVYAIKDKKIFYIPKYLLACVPNIICGILFLLIECNII